MKTQRKNGQRLYQQANNRWKWMAGATAAGVTATQAGLVTINLSNNYISATGGNHLNADLTGDGNPDLTIANAFNSTVQLVTTFGPKPYYTHFRARVSLDGILASAYRHNSAIPDYRTERLGSRVAHFNVTGGPPHLYGTYSLTGSIPVFFKI